MKKKKIIAIIIIVLVVLIVLFAIGYSLLKENDERIRNEAILDIVSEYVKSDDDFILQYGEVVSVDLYQDAELIVISRTECHVPCEIFTNTGKTLLVWIDYDFSGSSDTFTYISITEIIADSES